MTKTAIKRLRVDGSRFTILKILKKTEDELKAQGIQNPRFDAEVLLSKVLRVDRTGLYMGYDRILTEEEDRFLGLVKRRLNREPLQYILGSSEFYGLEFLVSPDVLIPRPETELLVEEALKRLTAHGSRVTILDLCTGSGCIAITLAKRLIGAQIYAVDISEKALRVAKENARRHRVEDMIKFIQGNLFEPFTLHASRFTVHDSLFDLILSNPPYIPSHEIDLLEPEVKYYEPRDAINGGPDGLRYIKKIIEEAPLYLRAGGSLLLEIGYNQSEGVCRMVEEAGVYETPEMIKDYAGFYRLVKVRKRCLIG